MIETIHGFDFAILDFIRDNLACPFLDAVVPVVTFLGNGGWFFIACAVLMLFFKKWRKTGIMIGCALVFGLLVCNVTLKPLIARTRPFDLREIELIISPPDDFSFPSGHTIAAFEFASVMMIRHRKLGIASLVLAVLLAFSRLYLYVHYPTDVIASVILGTLFGFLAVALVNAIYRRFGFDGINEN